MTTPTTARELFQTAYESRYTWDENFPGYCADVQIVVREDHEVVYTGKIFISRDLSVEVTDVADAQVEQGIYTQLQDLIAHRQHTSFEESFDHHEFILGDTDDTGAVEIFIKGDSIDSSYKIRDQKICQVRRVVGRMAFVIDTYENTDTGSGYIATRYNAVFQNAQTSEVSSLLKFEDTYEKIGDYYVMTKQVIQEDRDGNCTITEFSYSNITLLKTASV